jgi:hypothetical protein
VHRSTGLGVQWQITTIFLIGNCNGLEIKK